MKRLKQIALAFSILAGGVAMTGVAGALNFSTDTTGDDALDIQFTYAPVLTVSTGGNISITGLTPGASAVSDTSYKVTVSTNNSLGYTLSASVGCNTTGCGGYNTTDLRDSAEDDANKFSMISTAGALTSGTWGISLNGDATAESNFQALATTDTIINKTSKADGTAYSSAYQGGSATPFVIGAYATTTQPGGTYTNVINFVAVANPGS